MVPIPRLATVLRINVELPKVPEAFDNAADLIIEWWNKKAEPYRAHITPDVEDLSFSQNRFKAEFARTKTLFALAMEEPDSDSTLQREWICDFGLRQVEDRAQLEIRVSYRQPNNERRRPDPRAPRFLRDLLARVGAVDADRMSAEALRIDGEGVEALINLLFSPNRHLPVIAVSEENVYAPVSTSQSSAEILASSLARILAGAAHIVHLSADASWQLTKTLGAEWSVFQGAVRSYNPQMQWTDDRFRHRLWMSRDVQRSNAASRNGFLNVCAVHVFTQVTAQFEALQLLSPAVIRRQLAAEAQAEMSTAAHLVPEVFTLSEQLVKSKQLSLDVKQLEQTTELPRNKALELEPLVRENQELKSTVAALSAKLTAVEDAAAAREAAIKEIESQLEQERAGRAGDAQIHQEVKDDLWLHEQELRELKERDSLLQGGSSETSDALKPLWLSVASMFQTMHQVATQFRRLEEDSAVLAEVSEQNTTLNDSNAKLQAKLDSLSIRPSAASAKDDEYSIPRSAFSKILPQLIKKSNLDAVLQCFSLMFSDRCIVLDSAISASQASSDFRQTGKAFDLLCKLATEYWDAMRTGKGDVVARGAFPTEAYASKESEKISKAGVARRTFVFEGQPYYMEKHLKIGTADNSADTLRVHFEWVGGNRIVIGHCGKHLDF